MDEIDIWRAAAQLIKMYGDGAELAAAQRADKAIEHGSAEGERTWKRIFVAVRELSRLSRNDGENLN
jgi:hypothetical protein